MSLKNKINSLKKIIYKNILKNFNITHRKKINS